MSFPGSAHRGSLESLVGPFSRFVFGRLDLGAVPGLLGRTTGAAMAGPAAVSTTHLAAHTGNTALRMGHAADALAVGGVGGHGCFPVNQRPERMNLRPCSNQLIASP